MEDLQKIVLQVMQTNKREPKEIEKQNGDNKTTQNTKSVKTYLGKLNRKEEIEQRKELQNREEKKKYVFFLALFTNI